MERTDASASTSDRSVPPLPGPRSATPGPPTLPSTQKDEDSSGFPHVNDGEIAVLVQDFLASSPLFAETLKSFQREAKTLRASVVVSKPTKPLKSILREYLHLKELDSRRKQFVLSYGPDPAIQNVLGNLSILLEDYVEHRRVVRNHYSSGIMASGDAVPQSYASTPAYSEPSSLADPDEPIIDVQALRNIFDNPQVAEKLAEQINRHSLTQPVVPEGIVDEILGSMAGDGLLGDFDSFFLPQVDPPLPSHSPPIMPPPPLSAERRRSEANQHEPQRELRKRKKDAEMPPPPRREEGSKLKKGERPSKKQRVDSQREAEYKSSRREGDPEIDQTERGAGKGDSAERTGTNSSASAPLFNEADIEALLSYYHDDPNESAPSK